MELKAYTSAFQCLSKFVLDSSSFEQISRQIASIALSSIELGCQIVGLLAPIVNDLVESFLFSFKRPGITETPLPF
jgi:hypothetical protein